MKSSLTIDDVLSDIEFELVQGAISRSNLGQSIQTIKKHQSKLRSEIFDADQTVTDVQDIIGRQFQINDMLITLLQEMAATAQSLQQKFDRMGAARSGMVVRREPEQELNGTSKATGLATSKVLGRSFDEIKETMKPETLYLKLDMQPGGLPIIGGFIRQIRVALHNLVLYYIRLLAKKQTGVNQIYGDWLMYLQTADRHQAEEVELLRQQVTALQHRLDRLEGGSASSPE